MISAADVVLYAATLPPNIAAPRGQLIWNDYSEVDLDSPTTPETDTNIHEYDIVEDVRHYANYTTTSRFPPFQRALDEQDAMYAKMRLEEEEAAKNSTQTSTKHVKHAQGKLASTLESPSVAQINNRSARAARAVSNSAPSSPDAPYITRGVAVFGCLLG